MDAALCAAVEQRLGSPVRHARTASGGDINDAYRVQLADDRRLFVKTHPRDRGALPDMFACEARGLRWLSQARALRIASVVAACDEPPAFLALELIEPAPRARDHDERLGRGLAALHQSGAPRFGLDHDNYIGTLPQHNANASAERWSSFYVERRLEPQLARAVDAGRVDRALAAAFARLFANIDALCGPEEPPARLHGDLWGGNAIVDERGEPVLIDPAVYGGHREIDLAMMQLFGGFGPACFAAYDEAYPRAPGHEQRVGLYQLYPLLVHVNLFGGSYVERVQRIVQRHV